jgi:6-phosphogluconolactonase
MKQLKHLAAMAACLFVFAGCKKEIASSSTELPGTETGSQAFKAGGKIANNRNVYTLSNAVAGNEVLIYNRSAEGTLSYGGAVSTGGTGTGGGLGNQGAVILNEDNNLVLAVNAGSNSISSLLRTENGLQWKATVASGGSTPVSIAQHDDLVFVLNAGGSGNISGFRLDQAGGLEAIPNSTRPLSSAAAGAAQISFVGNGRVLVITEKATNKIITYTVDKQGIPGAMHSITSSTPTPFGFAPGRHGNIYVSEAAGGAAGASVLSSYGVASDGSITLLDGSVPTFQSAACWVVLTDNGRYAFATNTGSNSISAYGVQGAKGNLSLLQSVAAASDAGPIDAALSKGSEYLYVLNGAGHSITAYSVSNKGELNLIQTLAGIPAGANGLAAR